MRCLRARRQRLVQRKARARKDGVARREQQRRAHVVAAVAQIRDAVIDFGSGCCLFCVGGPCF
jgi:hypothetical protein